MRFLISFYDEFFLLSLPPSQGLKMKILRYCLHLIKKGTRTARHCEDTPRRLPCKSRWAKSAKLNWINLKALEKDSNCIGFRFVSPRFNENPLRPSPANGRERTGFSHIFQRCWSICGGDREWGWKLAQWLILKVLGMSLISQRNSKAYKSSKARVTSPPNHPLQALPRGWQTTRQDVEIIIEWIRVLMKNIAKIFTWAR